LGDVYFICPRFSPAVFHACLFDGIEIISDMVISTCTWYGGSFQTMCARKTFLNKNKNKTRIEQQEQSTKIIINEGVNLKKGRIS